LPKRKNGGAAEDDEISSALFVITDGFDFREDELLQRLDFAFPSCPKFGGCASSPATHVTVSCRVVSCRVLRSRFSSVNVALRRLCTYRLASSRNVRLFVNDKAYPDGAAGLLVHGKFRLDQIKAESFRPIGR
jgi:small ligand-binding sensory domain FIST